MPSLRLLNMREIEHGAEGVLFSCSVRIGVEVALDEELTGGVEGGFDRVAVFSD